MKFVDMNGKKVTPRVAAQFTYKGYMVSASTIVSDYSDIAILDMDGEFIKTDLNTVQDAIEYIDQL